MLHVRYEPLTFRLSAWPWGGSYKRFYDHNRHNIFIYPILEYLNQEFQKVPQSYVRSTTFTLVNVYSKFTGISFGRTVQPPDNVIRGPVTFTFAITRRDDTPMIANHIQWNTGMSTIWGPNLQYSGDYLTISLPISLCVHSRLSNTLMFQMETLYRLIGGWSKSHVLRRRSIATRTSDIRLIRNEFYHRSIPRTIWMYPWGDWKYAREMWDNGQDVMNVSDIDIIFLDYYLTNLRSFHDKSKFDHIRQAYAKLEDMVRDGILDIAQQTPSVYAIVVERFLPQQIVEDLRKGGSTFIIEQLAKDVCRGAL